MLTFESLLSHWNTIKDFFHLRVFSYNDCTETEDQNVLVRVSCDQTHDESSDLENQIVIKLIMLEAA